MHPALCSKAKMLNGRMAGHRQVFGLAGFTLSYWPLLPSSPGVNQCIENGGRSCSPLRDSSGFPPDSLLRPDIRPSITDRKLAQTESVINSFLGERRPQAPLWSYLYRALCLSAQGHARGYPWISSS